MAKENVYCPLCFRPMTVNPIDPQDGYYYCFEMHDSGKPVRVKSNSDEHKDNNTKEKE